MLNNNVKYNNEKAHIGGVFDDPQQVRTGLLFILLGPYRAHQL